MNVSWETALAWHFLGEGEGRIFFSRPQGSGFVDEAKQYFQRGIHERDSNPVFLKLNLRNASEGSVLSFMAERGWELVAASGGDAVARIYFRRSIASQ